MSIFDDNNSINPATGLPMIGEIGGIDVGGDTFGSSSIHDSMFESSVDISSSSDDTFSSISDDSFSSSCDDCCSNFDDTFSSGCGLDDW